MQENGSISLRDSDSTLKLQSQYTEAQERCQLLSEQLSEAHSLSERLAAEKGELESRGAGLENALQEGSMQLSKSKAGMLEAQEHAAGKRLLHSLACGAIQCLPANNPMLANQGSALPS